MSRLRAILLTCTILALAGAGPTEAQLHWEGSGERPDVRNATSAPTPPRNAAVESTAAGMLLTWDAPWQGNVTNYTVYRIINGTSAPIHPDAPLSPPGEPLAWLPPNQTWFLDQDVVQDMVYGYVVTAWNGTAESLPSNPAIGPHGLFRCPVLQIYPSNETALLTDVWVQPRCVDPPTPLGSAWRGIWDMVQLPRPLDRIWE